MTLRRTVGLALAVLLVSAPVVWAHDSGFGLARYTADGALDQSFGTGGLVVTRSAQRSFVANAVALQSDGRILVAGMVSDLASASLQLAVARYNPDGSADGGFGSAGLAATLVGAAGGAASTLALQPDGKILVAGTAFAHGSADDEFALARFTSAGQLDLSFGSEGIVTTDFGSGEAGGRPALDRAGGVAIESDGKIVVGGSTRGDHQAFAVARYNIDGSLDSSFGVGGKAQIPAEAPQ